MSEKTRERFIAVAQRQFAEKGFYGTSIASISEELGLTKQALLHHFGSKEKLYAEVLKMISDQHMDAVRTIQSNESDPRSQLEALIVAPLANSSGNEAPILIMRELLDNRDRAHKAGTWYLKPYLEALTGIVQRIDPAQKLSKAQALALVYQLLGAVNYIRMSEPTLTQMFGKTAFAEMKREYPGQLRMLIRARFDS